MLRVPRSLFLFLIVLAFGILNANVSFAQTDLTAIQMTKSCSKCNLANQQLQMADFSRVSFREVIFDGANLQNANFNGSLILWSYFRNANLKAANFTQSRIGNDGRAQLWNNADMRGAIFSNATFGANDFLSASLSGANFANSEFNSYVAMGLLDGRTIQKLTFTKARVDFFTSRLLLTGRFKSANFDEFIGKIISFQKYNYSFKDYPILEMVETSFDKSMLKNSNFEDANLTASTFRNADLRGVNFRGADLTDVDLTGAKMDGADIFGAKLCNTTAPDGNIMFGGC